MFLKIFQTNKCKQISLMYKLFLFKKRIELNTNGISWFFLVVNSRSEQTVSFLRNLKFFGYKLRRKRVVGLLRLVVQDFLLKVKGVLVNVTLGDISSFIDFISVYYTKAENLIFALKPLCFIYQNICFFFFNSYDFINFKIFFVEPLKFNKFPQVLLYGLKQLFLRFNNLLRRALVNLYGQLLVYNFSLKK